MTRGREFGKRNGRDASLHEHCARPLMPSILTSGTMADGGTVRQSASLAPLRIREAVDAEIARREADGKNA